MGLEFAIEELYATGWTAIDSTGCEFAPDGRAFPGVQRVHREVQEGGCALHIRKADLFDCYRAEWQGADGTALGAVVGQTEQEAAVYALAQLRRSLMHAGSA